MPYVPQNSATDHAAGRRPDEPRWCLTKGALDDIALPMPSPGLLLLFSLLLGHFAPVAWGEDEEPTDLVQARSLYSKEIEFATRPIRDRYLSKLDLLKRTLGGRGDARGAVAVQEEIDRIKGAAETGLLQKFVGLWKIEYSNGATRRYAIKADGLVQAEGEDGKPIPSQKGRIAARGGDVLLELSGERKLERLTLAGDVLNIEHFDPKTTYPSGPPAARAKGTRIPASP